MSRIAALCRWDGRPVDDALMARMLDAVAHQGAGARGVWSAGAVTLGQVVLCADPSTPADRGPTASADGICVAFDGRLDNRRELRAGLADAGIRADAATDADLVLCAYRVWGYASIAKLLGDFAILIWDAARRELVCARDPVGARPLVYYTDGRQFVAGSESQQLLAARAFEPEPNEGVVGDYLCGRMSSREETLYRNVFRLEPAHLLIANVAGIRKSNYYDPHPQREIRYRSDGEYAEHFFSLLADAIRCRVPDTGPIGAYLSGGVDSSSVVSLAEHMRRRGLIRDVPIVTLSMTARTRAGDERRYVDAVVRRWGLTSHQVEPAVVAPEIFVDQVKRYRDMPEYPNVAAADALLSVARQEGCRTLLTGLGGDDWLCAPYFHGPELLAQGKLLEFVRQLRFEDGSAWPRSMAATFLRRGLWPLVPERWRGMVSAARARHGLPPHIADGFARATCLRERTKKPTMHRRRCPSRTQQELYDWFWGADLPYVNESEERHHAELGMEARHPFHDRRVIEFALAIPERQRWRAMQSKFVLRRALGDLLPAEVSSRETKGDYSHTIADALHAAGGDRCFERLESARRGWVRAGVVQETYRRMRALYEKGDEQYSTDAYGLWTVYGLDLWLTHAFD